MPFVAGEKLRAQRLNDLIATGDVTLHAMYTASGSQSIPHQVTTTIAFGTADQTTSLVTRSASGAGHRFTLNRSGIWAVSATVRFFGVAGGGERYAELVHVGGTCAANGTAVPGSQPPVTMNPTVTRHFSAGDWIEVRAWQSSGGPIALDPAGGWVRVHLAWLHA